MRDVGKPVVIVNPAARNGRVAALLPVFKGAFAPDAGGVFVTLRPGDAEQWARTFRQHPGIIAIGGDGTLHEVLNGMDLKRQTLGILPLGSSISLGRDLGRPDLAKLLVAMTETEPRAVDVLALSLTFRTGKRMRRYVAATIGLGYPADIVERTESTWHGLGPLRYPLAAGTAAFGLNRFTATVIADGGKPQKKKLTGVLISNTRHAGTVPMFPKASIADGHFDLMEMSGGLLRQALHNLSVLSRLNLYVPAVVRQAKRVRITLDRPRTLMADGEWYDDVIAVDIRILPKRLRLWIPTGARI